MCRHLESWEGVPREQRLAVGEQGCGQLWLGAPGGPGEALKGRRGSRGRNRLSPQVGSVWSRPRRCGGGGLRTGSEGRANVVNVWHRGAGQRALA